jgi:hypothetical protein
MEKSHERSLARKIVRQVATNMRPFGYRLTKPTFLCREYPQIIAFFHFHKFSFGPYFRVHFGIRVLNSSFVARALNGPSFEDAEEYGEDDESVSRYVQKLSELLITEGIPWVEDWLSPERLVAESRSPLAQDEKSNLLRALSGHANPEYISLSHRLFGIKSA